MTTNDKLEKISEAVYARLTNSMLKQLSDKYQDLLKEKTDFEMEKENLNIERDYPEYGAICVNLDGCELSFPFNNDTVIEIVDGKDVTTFKAEYDIDITEILNAILNAKSELVGIRTYTTKDVEFYNKQKLYKEDEKVKYTKVYEKHFSGVYPKRKVSAVYKVIGRLK